MLLNFNPELTIQPYRQGIQLIDRKEAPATSNSDKIFSHSLSTILNLNINTYFVSKDGIINKMNDAAAITGGYLSSQNAIGKSIEYVAKKGTADSIIENDLAVIKSQHMIIKEEGYFRKDDVYLPALAIKYPWYYQDSIIGIFGFAILLDGVFAKPLSESLSQLINLGFLRNDYWNSPNKTHQRFFTRLIEDFHLSPREVECLHYLILGKTVKGIGLILGISYRTIYQYLANVKFKMNVYTNNQLIEKGMNILLNE